MNTDALNAVGRGLRRVSCKKSLGFLAVTLALLLFSVPTFAQLNLGHIFGAVTDSGGGVVVGATVTVIDIARGISRPLVTDSAGEYSAPSLIPGLYTVRAEAKGFKTEEHSGITVGVGQDVRVDMVVQPGETTQTVTVTGDLPQIETTNATLGGTIENTSIEELPLNGRDYQYMLGQRPGIVMHPNAGANDFPSNGSRSDDVVWMFDGLFDVNIYGGGQSVVSAYQLGPDQTNILPLDAVQEVDIVESPKAEYGDRAGAHVNVGLKSGTNSVHGTAYAFGRDTSLNAKNPFLAEPAGFIQLPKAPLNLEQYGASVGGPLKKDKLFYFMNYEGQSYIVGNPRVQVLPTTADIPATPGTSIPESIYDLLHNAGNLAGTNPAALSVNMAGCEALTGAVGGVPSGTYSAAQITQLKTFSASQIAGYCSPAGGLFLNNTTNANFAEDLLSTGGSQNAIIKFDWHPSDKHAINGEMYMGGGRDIAPGSAVQPWMASDLYTWSDVWRAVWIYTPNSSIQNEARVGFEYGQLPVYLYECDTKTYPNLVRPNYSAWGLVAIPCTYTNATPPGPITGGFPTLNVSGFASLSGAGIPQDGLQQYLTLTDAVSYTRGKHIFKVGVSVRPQYFVGSTPVGGRGIIAFGGTNAFNPSGTLTGAGTAGALDDFIAGLPSSTGNSLYTGNQTEFVRLYSYAAFVQDDWRLTPRLTVNLGVRWEYTNPLISSNNQLANFDAASPTGLIQEVTGKDVYKPKMVNLTPRFGLAWDVTGNGRTVVHANVSIMNTTAAFLRQLMYNGGAVIDGIPTGFTYYNANGTVDTAYNTIYNANLVPIAGAVGVKTGTLQLASNAIPWLVNTPILNGSPSGLACGNGAAIPGSTPVKLNPSPCTLNAEGLKPAFPYWINRSLGIQHAFTTNFALTVNYVGSHGTQLQDLQDINTPPPGPKLTTTEQANRPYATQFPDFAHIYVENNQDDSNYDAMQITASQRLSHGLNFTAGYGLAYSHDEGSFGTPSNGINPKADYAYGGDDARNIFTFTATYNLPSKKSPGQVLEGWQVNSSLNLTGAFPLNPTDASDDFNGTGLTAQRWTMIGPASNINRLIGGPGAGVPCFGIAGSSFANAKNCADVSSGLPTGAVIGTAAYVQNMPAACVAAAAAEPVNSSAAVSSGVNGTGLYSLASTGCYLNGNTVIVPPAQGTFGNMVRDALRDKAFHNLDMSVSKTWKFRERYSAQFKAEFFNIMNRTGYAPPGVSLVSPSTFGQSTNTNDSGNAVIGAGPRKIQLGLKLSF